MAVAVAAMVVALGGTAAAATGVLHIGTENIDNGAVTNSKLADGSVSDSKLNSQLLDRVDSGKDALNPAFAVVNVTPVNATNVDTANPNPDSGPTGDHGWYFSGFGAAGTAQFTDGELELTGSGVDANTWQGGVGIAHAYNAIPLSELDALAYDFSVDTVNGNNAPTIHVTVTGATTNSKFTSSGFTNLVLAPALNHFTIEPGVQYHADGFGQSALWYSTDNPSTVPLGGQGSPQPMSYFVDHNPNAVIDQISLDNGGSTGASGAFDSFADGLLIGLNGINTRYDFGG
ncbi:MAG: hypothetical protein KGL15_00030 [Acidobacteriota bacterium]|nr:hypothetical protein [Acidobacteriota bacterium]